MLAPSSVSLHACPSWLVALVANFQLVRFKIQNTWMIGLDKSFFKDIPKVNQSDLIASLRSLVTWVSLASEWLFRGDSSGETKS